MIRNFILLISLLGICSSSLISQEAKSIDEKIIEYVQSVEGKKIDRGECWDLVAYALDYANANWERPTGFGKKIDQKKEAIKSGDVIAFENVKFTNPDKSWMTFPHHYAIITDVKSQNEITIVHQNYANVKKVSYLDLNLSNITKGKITIYRPQI